jgi:osmotically-inducible protein OsmY
MHKPNNLLESDVQDELDWDPQLNDSRIVVKAAEGVITLSGAVDTYSDSLCACEDAWRVSGVKDVENDLLVGPIGEAVVDVEIATDCLTALDADKVVPDGAVTVDVSDGWVTLHGQVKRHYQRKAAEHAVERVDGVLGVSDEIVIAPDPTPDNVADLINKAFARNAIIDESQIKVSSDGSTVYLDGSVSSWTAMQTAMTTAWNAPGVTSVVNRLEIIL